MTKRIELKHRSHTIMAMVMGGKPAAMVHPDKHKIEGVPTETLDAVIERAKAWIDAKRATAAANRRAPNIATIEEYREALAAVNLKPNEAAMLNAHATAKDHSLTATQIAAAAGYKSFASSNSHYGKFARRIGEYLDLTPIKRKDGSSSWTTCIASAGEHDPDDADEHFVWRLHDEFVDALAVAGVSGTLDVRG